MALWQDVLAQHYRGSWGQIGENCPFAAGPVQQLPVDFEVLRFKPTSTRAVWTYATVGMSQPREPNAVELHIFAPEASPSIVELLYATAHYHRTASPLGVGHSVNFGRPWLPGSSCDHGLVSLPYLDGPDLRTLGSMASVSDAFGCFRSQLLKSHSNKLRGWTRWKPVLTTGRLNTPTRVAMHLHNGFRG